MIKLFEMYEGRKYIYYHPLRNDWIKLHVELLSVLKQYGIDYDFYKVEDWIDKINPYHYCKFDADRSMFKTSYLNFGNFEGLPYYTYILIATNMKKYPKCFIWGNDMSVYLENGKSSKFYKIKSEDLPERLEPVGEAEVFRNMKIWNKKYDEQCELKIQSRDAEKFGI